MLLSYNPDSDAYEGQRLSVPRWLWDEGVAELVEGGLSESAARGRMLDESEWLDVERSCCRCALYCRKPLPPGQRFCNVLCQAAFIAEAHG